MHQYRDIHEYHDPCYYCKCDKCSNEGCQLNKCNFCQGGKGCATEKCEKHENK